jgi:hypothetical protein
MFPMIPVSAAARRPKGRLRENSRDVIRGIAGRTGMSRDTAKKYLRASEEMPRYAEHASSSKFDPNAATLATWLASEVTRSRKQRCVQRILGRIPKLTNARADASAQLDVQLDRANLSSYEHVSYLLATQVFVRIPIRR